MAGITKMKVIVVEIPDQKQQFLTSVVANFGRAEHGPLEIADAIAQFRSDGMTVVQISEVFARSDAWIYLYLRVADKLVPEVKQMMSQEVPEDDRLTFTAAVLVADVPAKLQPKIAKTIVSKKLKMVQAKDLIRKEGKKRGFSVGNPKRTPNKDWEVMKNFLGKMQRELDVFMGSPQDFFDRMFESRPAADHASMQEVLQRNIENLGKLLEVLQATQK